MRLLLIFSFLFLNSVCFAEIYTCNEVLFDTSPTKWRSDFSVPPSKQKELEKIANDFSRWMGLDLFQGSRESLIKYTNSNNTFASHNEIFVTNDWLLSAAAPMVIREISYHVFWKLIEDKNQVLSDLSLKRELFWKREELFKEFKVNVAKLAQARSKSSKATSAEIDELVTKSDDAFFAMRRIHRESEDLNGDFTALDIWEEVFTDLAAALYYDNPHIISDLTEDEQRSFSLKDYSKSEEPQFFFTSIRSGLWNMSQSYQSREKKILFLNSFIKVIAEIISEKNLIETVDWERRDEIGRELIDRLHKELESFSK